LNKKLSFIAIFGFLLALAFNFGLQSIHVFFVPQNVIAIKSIDFYIDQHNVLSEESIKSSKVLADQSKWKTVKLPHDWYLDHVELAVGWYHYQFNIEAVPLELWAVYIPSVQMNAKVYLNGVALGDGGRFRDPVARNWSRPLYFSIPSTLLKKGNNSIVIKVKADPISYGILSTVYLAEEKRLKPSFERMYFLRYTVNQFIFIALILMALLMIMLWRHRKHESLFAWLALSILAWSVHDLNLMMVNIPVSTKLWHWISFSSMLWFTITATIFVQHYCGRVNYSYQRFTFLVGIALPLVNIFIADQYFYLFGFRVVIGIALIMGIYPVVRLLQHAWLESHSGVLLVLFAGQSMLVFGMHDMLMVYHVIEREDGYFIQYAAPIALFAFTNMLLQRFINALTESESLNAHLEERIREKHTELENNYQQLKEMEHHEIVVDERERIMRDMHDGIGGHLVSSIALIDSGLSDKIEIREALQLALDDLRLIIDSMEDYDDDLLIVLGMLRQRLEPRLRTLGIRFNWKVIDLPPLSNFGPEKVLHVMRIIQEAVTNIIKYANASELTISTGTHTNDNGQAGVFINICDNGNGFKVEPEKSGHGLSNMRKRASILQAEISIQSHSEVGTVVNLWLPLQMSKFI